MPSMIQIRNVPVHIHRELKIRAARDGATLSAYILKYLSQLASQPSMDEIVETLRKKSERTGIYINSAKLVREERNAR